jgi:hypothetical protein
MKKIGDYTMKGRIPKDSNSNRILLDDGRFDTGYRVIDFIIAPTDPNNAAEDMNAKLTTEPTTLLGWSWDDNTQIAWAVSENRVTGSPVFGRSIIDPDNLIIQDLFIQCENSGSGEVNYMVKLEKYDIREFQGALAMVRNKSQGAD